MKYARFVCLFAILISMLLLAQSGRAPLRNQPNGIAQQRHPALPPNLSQMPQGAPFAQRGARAFKEPAIRRGNSSSGLNFAPAVTYGSGGFGASSVAVADVNGDGKPDLVVANGCVESTCSTNGDGAAGVLLGNGDGTFQAAVTYDSGGFSPESVAIADVNGDGKPDLIVANWCASINSNGGCSTDGVVSVLIGNGDGTFQTAVTYDTGGFETLSVAVADVNGDGKPDVLVANVCASETNCNNGIVGVLLGNGDGTFQTAVTYGSGGHTAESVAVADVNGDGKPDLVVANQCVDSSCSTDGAAGVLLGNGDGTFQAAVTYDSGGLLSDSIAVADVNGDGKPDLVVANACGSTIIQYCDPQRGANGTVGVLLGNGDGTFQPAVTYDTDCTAESVAVADVNGDGKPDLVVAGCSVNVCSNGVASILLGNGDGTFQAPVSYSASGWGEFSVVATDVNGDGIPDVVVADSCDDRNCFTGSIVAVLINMTTFPTQTSLGSSPNPSNLGQAVTFTATVTSQAKKFPTGTVSFIDGTTNIGNSNLNSSGMATLTTSTLVVGTHSMTATYNGNTNFLPSTSPVLYQVVQGAIASLSPSSLNFGSQTVGITSTPQVVMLTNTGNINLTITSIQITGTNSGDFAQTNNCPGSVPPNNGCQISVTFTPTAAGTRNAALTITDNAPDSPQSVPLTGVGVLPAVTFSPTSLTFPNQVVFTTSPAQQVTLTNSGAGVLTIARISVTGPFHQTNNCPNSLNPGANCTISVGFHPKNKGAFHGALSVTDNAPGSPQKVPLTGTGTYVQLVPTKLNFGTQPVGTRSLARKITLTNKGSVAVNISGIAITGTDAGDFAETNTCGKSVASGASCFIKVTFKPLVKGKRTADVSVYDNGGGSPQDVGLTGTGT
jgi:hypothetical protein